MLTDPFACLEEKAVVLLESRSNADSAKIQERATVCLTMPVTGADGVDDCVRGQSVDAVVFNDVLTETPRACAVARAVITALRPGACFMICESYWAIDTALESCRMQAMFSVRNHAHRSQQLPLWQRGQLYSIMQGFGLGRIVFAPIALEPNEYPEWLPECDRPPLSDVPANRIHVGRMRMWGFKPDTLNP